MNATTTVQIAEALLYAAFFGLPAIFSGAFLAMMIHDELQDTSCTDTADYSASPQN